MQHSWEAWRFGKALCVRCGLIWLRNKATEKAVRCPCPGSSGD